MLSCAGRLSVESPLKLHTIVPTFDKSSNNDNNNQSERSARGAVEISNWQTNFPAVCQGVANSVSYIMEQEFYCFRKLQHISRCSFDRRPSSPLRARCSVHLPPLWPWPWPAPVKDCHAGIHMSVSVCYPLNCYCITFASTHTHTQTDRETRTHPVGNYKADRWIKQPQSTFRESAAGFQVAYVMCH